MLLALTSDWQLSEQARYSRRTPEGITTRLSDQVRCIEWTAVEARKRGATAMAVLGDVFDQRNAITTSVLDQAGRAFAFISAQFSGRLCVLVGNHDAPLRAPTLTSLRVLGGYAKIIDKPVVVDGCAFVPWADDPDEFRGMIGKVVKRAPILCSHVLMQGIVPNGHGLPLEALRPKAWKGVFLGDVHEPVQLARNVQYLGAPMQHHYGDAGGKRGFWLVDTKTAHATFVENTISPRFHVVTQRKPRGIRAGDFVRIAVTDVDLQQELAVKVGKITTQVESRPVQEDEYMARLDVGVDATDRTLIERYVRLQLDEPNEGLVELGVQLLRSAAE